MTRSRKRKPSYCSSSWQLLLLPHAYTYSGADCHIMPSASFAQGVVVDEGRHRKRHVLYSMRTLRSRQSASEWWDLHVFWNGVSQMFVRCLRQQPSDISVRKIILQTWTMKFECRVFCEACSRDLDLESRRAGCLHAHMLTYTFTRYIYRSTVLSIDYGPGNYNT